MMSKAGELMSILEESDLDKFAKDSIISEIKKIYNIISDSKGKDAVAIRMYAAQIDRILTYGIDGSDNEAEKLFYWSR